MKEAGLGRGRSWIVMWLEKNLSGFHAELGWTVRVIPNWGKVAKPLSSSLMWVPESQGKMKPHNIKSREVPTEAGPNQLHLVTFLCVSM